MSSIVELDLTLTNSSSDRTAIMTPPCASALLSFLYTLYPREGLKNSSTEPGFCTKNNIRGCGINEYINILPFFPDALEVDVQNTKTLL